MPAMTCDASAATNPICRSMREMLPCSAWAAAVGAVLPRRPSAYCRRGALLHQMTVSRSSAPGRPGNCNGLCSAPSELNQKASLQQFSSPSTYSPSLAHNSYHQRTAAPTPENKKASQPAHMRLTYHVQPQFGAQLVPEGVVGVMAAPHRIKVELLHQPDVLRASCAGMRAGSGENINERVGS